jgi:hypothetical protein
MELFTNILYAYFLTVIIELITVCSFYKDKQKIIYFSLLINAITNIPLTIIIYFLPSNIPQYAVIITLEILIFIIESLFYAFLDKKTYKKGFLVSLIANSSSVIFGLILNIIVSLI